jgi:proline dehydrogenase
MRTVLLWMAGNRWLREHLPRLWFARRAVRRFMPGEDVDAALAAGAGFEREGIATLYTRLGENLANLAEADEVADHYVGLIERIAQSGIHGEVSVKLTQLGLDLDVERTFAHASRLAAAAAQHGAVFWIDMEGSAYTEATIAFYERLKTAHPNVGLCLQAYLRRTASDVDRLLPLDPSIRLVKGAYAEPAAIAFRSKAEVDASYVALAVAILQAKAAGRSVNLGLGTHDVGLIRQIAERAAALRLDRRAAFEVQMLYGVRETEQRRLAAEGYAVRDLIAYGEHWYPWYMRRLAERPANIVFALRQIVG